MQTIQLEGLLKDCLEQMDSIAKNLRANPKNLSLETAITNHLKFTTRINIPGYVPCQRLATWPR